MRHRLLAALLIALLPAAAIAAPASPGIPIPEIAYQKYVLGNGLTLIVHEDHKAPIVAVNVWYHVGSKNEKPGKTGFAHLFEHLMFNGTENFNDDYFKVLEKLGATDLNGTTNEDRTNYFQNVPVTRTRHRALDGVRPHGPPARRDRPGEARRAARRRAEREAAGRERALRPGVRAHADRRLPQGPPLLVDRDRLDGGPRRRLARRREGVVQDLLRPAERGARGRRRREGRGREGAGREVLRRHPARAADREARRLDREAHGTSTARRSRTGSPRRASTRSGTRRSGARRTTTTCRSSRDVLASGKTSRLYKRLVYDDQIATDVSAYQGASEIGEHVRDPGHRASRAATSRPSRRRSTRSWRACCGTAPPPTSSSARRPSGSPASCAASSASAGSAASPTSWRRARSAAAAPTSTARGSSG